VRVAQRHQCFYARTTFQQSDGKLVRAAQLGLPFREDELLTVIGPHGEHVPITHVKDWRGKHQLVSLRTGGVDSLVSELIVTTDHRVRIRDANGQAQDATALKVARAWQRGHIIYIFDGNAFRKLTHIEIRSERCHVVEVCFADDAEVLAWLLPSGRSKPGTVKLERAFAVRGNRHLLPTVTRKGLFLEVQEPRDPSLYRRLSLPSHFEEGFEATFLQERPRPE